MSKLYLRDGEAVKLANFSVPIAAKFADGTSVKKNQQRGAVRPCEGLFGAELCRAHAVQGWSGDSASGDEGGDRRYEVEELDLALSRWLG